MATISHREFRTWCAWKKDQFNNPSRTDYYLMQIAGYVDHVMSKKSWKVNRYKIPFSIGRRSKVKADEQVKRDKARWFRRVGL